MNIRADRHLCGHLFFVGIAFLTCAYVSDLRDVFILRISGSQSQEMMGLTLNGLKYTKSSISILPQVVHVTMINNKYFIFFILENVDDKKCR